jgi:superfamily II DNA or RNA helicase
MPRVFDNIDQTLLPALKQTLAVSERADFCVGYFNLRGWKSLDSLVDQWSGNDGECCRLLVGMQALPQKELEEAFNVGHNEDGIDNQTAIHKKRELAKEFRDQLMLGAPTNEDEAGLRRLSNQLRTGKLRVKLFLRHRLHAKLYLAFRQDPNNPIIGFLGSSNLTFSGLQSQGELNIDVLDHDACEKLRKWFEDRWTDRWCIDISKELADIIDESWASPEDRLPYHIYLKIAFHLAEEARSGLKEFSLPPEFESILFDFQTAAVKIAAHHLNKRGGVMIGDVVGLGKTMMATALARMIEDEQGIETLILCPKNLEPMWLDYRERFGLRGKVMSTSRVQRDLPHERRYKLVMIDESHNLRNREGKRFATINDYISTNECKVVLLTATPYNKNYLDLSNQLRLFLKEDADLGVRPEEYIRTIGETEFIRRHQCSPKSLAAFEKSSFPDDWRELMRLYMVRRTRTFVKENYADVDCGKCGTRILACETKCSSCDSVRTGNARPYLTFSDGTRAPFPTRVPKTVRFELDDDNPADQYASLYSAAVVRRINQLELPRYGLGNYIHETPSKPPKPADAKIINDLSRAGKRLMGFCRTNLFKRLESSGQAFLQSIERHILRNFVYLHALDNQLEIPIGSQDASLLDASFHDEELELFDDNSETSDSTDVGKLPSHSESDYTEAARIVYGLYAGKFRNRFKWLPADRFVPELARDLRSDAMSLVGLLKDCGAWKAESDAKLNALFELVSQRHFTRKVLVFTQFADTAYYLKEQLELRGVDGVGVVTGQTSDPTTVAWKFSPISNDKSNRISPNEEFRILIATDVLSEGQNLQDSGIVVNFDIPWAIIRLIQRAGRVDRIGQKCEEILCYTFLPAAGVERIINLRGRVRQRLQENAEVVGTDEAFFEDDPAQPSLVDLYNEQAGILDGEDDTQIDLSSYAFQIWDNAIKADPSLANIIPNLPSVVYATKPHEPSESRPDGVLVYARTSERTNALAWINQKGEAISESQYAILKAAACDPDTPALPRQEKHHELVRKAVELIANEEKQAGGQLGRPSGARFRVYERMKRFVDDVRVDQPLFPVKDLERAIGDIYGNPLRPLAVDILNRLLKSGITDEDLAHRVLELRAEGRLCILSGDEENQQETQIICSMGLKAT